MFVVLALPNEALKSSHICKNKTSCLLFIWLCFFLFFLLGLGIESYCLHTSQFYLYYSVTCSFNPRLNRDVTPYSAIKCWLDLDIKCNRFWSLVDSLDSLEQRSSLSKAMTRFINLALINQMGYCCQTVFMI